MISIDKPAEDKHRAALRAVSIGGFLMIVALVTLFTVAIEWGPIVDRLADALTPLPV